MNLSCLTLLAIVFVASIGIGYGYTYALGPAISPQPVAAQKVAPVQEAAPPTEPPIQLVTDRITQTLSMDSSYVTYSLYVFNPGNRSVYWADCVVKGPSGTRLYRVQNLNILPHSNGLIRVTCPSEFREFVEIKPW